MAVRREQLCSLFYLRSTSLAIFLGISHVCIAIDHFSHCTGTQDYLVLENHLVGTETEKLEQELEQELEKLNKTIISNQFK